MKTWNFCFCMKKIRLLTLFSGCDSQALAMERLKRDYPSEFDYELVAWCEVDDAAIKSHNALFPQWNDRNVGDICKVNPDDLPDCDVATYSFPCFVAGTWVRTSNGLKKIEDVTTDDYVLTHTNSYQKVVKTMNRNYQSVTYSIDCPLFQKLICTENHPLYVRAKTKGHTSNRKFGNSQWLSPRDMMADLTKEPLHGIAQTRGYFIGYAINNESKLPKWERVAKRQVGHNNPDKELSELFTNKHFWYLMGRYVGDGWKRESKTGNGIVICCGGRNEDKLVDAMNRCGIHYSKAIENTVVKYHISSGELYKFVDRYGYYAHGKRVDAETVNLPVELLRAFVEGVIDSDGCKIGNWYQITSVSEELIYDLGQCIAKVYHRGFAINFCKRSKKTVIENREVNQRDTWMIRWKMSDDKQDRMFYEDGYIWAPIMKLTWQQSRCQVYNMEVETDNSYTANGVIVHNCQDISNAGKQKGFSKDSGTRSSLLWECEKIFRVKRPKYLLMENVKALTQQKFMPLFKEWIALLDDMGYTTFWKVINSRDMGVAQNRERVFAVSILRTEDDPNPTYNFPAPIPLEKCVEDYMEPAEDIGEEYYIDQKRVTEKVLSDILDQPNVRKEMEELYHAEWKERQADSPKL